MRTGGPFAALPATQHYIERTEDANRRMMEISQMAEILLFSFLLLLSSNLAVEASTKQIVLQCTGYYRSTFSGQTTKDTWRTLVSVRIDINEKDPSKSEVRIEDVRLSFKKKVDSQECKSTKRCYRDLKISDQEVLGSFFAEASTIPWTRIDDLLINRITGEVMFSFREVAASRVENGREFNGFCEEAKKKF